MAVIDLKSDTVTKPGKEMRKAMYEAEVGDDVYGEDPTVIALEQKAAMLTGKEAGLFVVSGTMGNLVSLLTHCSTGDGAILGNKSHIYYYEAGGMAAMGGILPLIVDDSDGIPECEDIKHWCRPSNIHFAPAKLLCLENTHNKGGGIAVSPERFTRTVECARELGLPVHLDGARVFNAAAAFKVKASEFTAQVDSVQLCLSKGLGAPVGSLICASPEFIEKARYWRKKVGGGMRQAGIIAAAGLYALENNIERLEEDHENAVLIANVLKDAGISVEESSSSTNMVFFRTGPGLDEDAFLSSCFEKGVQFNKVEPGRFRLVTHIDVTREQALEGARIIADEVGSWA